MKNMQLPRISKDKPHFNRKRSEGEREYQNHLKQNFNPKAPNQVWASDLTYIKANGKWYYLCVVIDLFSRKVVGWQLSAKADVNLVMNAFLKAYEARKRPSGLMFHSDRGIQYTSEKFRNLMDELNVVHSFSKKGYPFDNAVCESFFKHMKREEVDRRQYHSYEELMLSVFEYIEKFYNTERPHGSLGYSTPVEIEDAYWSTHSQHG